MVMGSYAGPARVTADGVPYEVIAQMVSFAEYKVLVADPFGGLEHLYGIEPRWIGTIHTRTTVDAWTISQSDELAIQTEEGRESCFTVKSGGDLCSSELDIVGIGSPPFAEEAEPDAV